MILTFRLNETTPRKLLLGTRTRRLGSAQTIAPVFSLAFRPLSSHSTVFPVLPTSLLPIILDSICSSILLRCLLISLPPLPRCCYRCPFFFVGCPSRAITLCQCTSSDK